MTCSRGETSDDHRYQARAHPRRRDRRPHRRPRLARDGLRPLRRALGVRVDRAEEGRAAEKRVYLLALRRRAPSGRRGKDAMNRDEILDEYEVTWRQAAMEDRAQACWPMGEESIYRGIAIRGRWHTCAYLVVDGRLQRAADTLRT